jgi:TPR repeat protein
MKRTLATLRLTLAVLLGSAGMSWSADYQKGLTAARSGDYATALREWKPFAEQGVADAQSNLGAMYADGQGVIQDYVRAHMWFNIAASSGHENITENVSVRRMGGVFIGFNKIAVTNRDIVAKRMTPADISAAQTLARECVLKKYKGC